MIIIYTPERAERLARTCERQGLRVERIDQAPVVAVRDYGQLRITSRVYARVWKGAALRMNITYESIDSGSVIL
jgi:hypothetical protein